MNQFQQRVSDSLGRSDTFAGAHADVLGPIATSQARQDLQAVIAEVKQHDTNQGSAERLLDGQMARQVALAKELVRKHLRPIAKFAKGKLRGVPEYAELTATVDTNKPRKLITVARTMAVAAAKYADKFTAAGLVPDTVARLIAATNALEDAMKQRIAARGLRKNATNSLDDVLARGRDAVRVLESAITQVLKHDDPLLATWKSESRIEDKPGNPRKVKKADPAVAPVAPAALPATTTQHS